MHPYYLFGTYIISKIRAFVIEGLLKNSQKFIIFFLFSDELLLCPRRIRDS